MKNLLTQVPLILQNTLDHRQTQWWHIWIKVISAFNTYPESHPEDELCTFRADIEVSTCGLISPLKAHFHFHYRLPPGTCGFTRDTTGVKHYIDHKIDSIQNFIPEDIEKLYNMVDVNVYSENIFHTKMMVKNLDLKHYLFDAELEQLSEEEKKRISDRLYKEMQEIYYGCNFS